MSNADGLGSKNAFLAVLLQNFFSMASFFSLFYFILWILLISEHNNSENLLYMKEFCAFSLSIFIAIETMLIINNITFFTSKNIESNSMIRDFIKSFIVEYVANNFNFNRNLSIFSLEHRYYLLPASVIMLLADHYYVVTLAYYVVLTILFLKNQRIRMLIICSAESLTKDEVDYIRNMYQRENDTQSY